MASRAGRASSSPEVWRILLYLCLASLGHVLGRHVPPVLSRTAHHHALSQSIHSQGHHVKDQGHEMQADDPEQEAWLDDYTKDFLYEMQADSVGHQEFGKAELFASPDHRHRVRPQCPPPPEHVPSFGCDSEKCHSDKECLKRNSKCCYNGCTFTCLPALPPPAVVDWWKEPPRRLQSVEPCSTSHVTDEDDLLCPHGFICHIENPGDLANGVPNWGHCVKEHSSRQESGRIFKLKLKTENRHGQNNNGSCSFDNSVIQDGANFWYDKHPCTCSAGSITCKVGPLAKT